MLKKSLFLSILFSLPGFCEEEATKTPPKPQIKRINDNEYQIGKIQVDKEKRQLSFKAGVNMTKGLIEYCLATTKSDKVHETLFLTDVSPLNINIAMKLLGIKESKELFEIIDEDSWKPSGKFPEVTPEIHAASLVEIIIEWSEGDQKKTLPVNELIHHINWPKETETPKPNQEVKAAEATLSVMQKGPWLTTGSYIHEGRFKAEVGGIIFGIYTNEQAVVNFSGKDRQLGDVWIPNEKVVPAEGTVVKIIVKPHTPKK
ncbi:MAG: YdjY domain-containing protein [Akkermansiaceae bacterium]|jgi:hypothetical protein